MTYKVLNVQIHLLLLKSLSGYKQSIISFSYILAAMITDSIDMQALESGYQIFYALLSSEVLVSGKRLYSHKKTIILDLPRLCFFAVWCHFLVHHIGSFGLSLWDTVWNWNPVLFVTVSNYITLATKSKTILKFKKKKIQW